MALQIQFYKPDPNKATVVDNNGNYVSLADYKRITGQTSVPDNQLNWSYVQNGPPPTKTSTPTQIAPTTQLAQTNQPPPTGVDPNLWNTLSPADKAFVTAMNTNAQNTYQQGVANYSINAQTMQKALEVAQNDPTIKAIYGDQAKMALSDLHNNLGQINAEYAQQYGLMTAEQAQARKDLAEREAAAGRAQSGFRQQAQNLQQQQQTAVIQSSKRQLEQQVRQLGSQYESQFGSKALVGAGPITAGGATYAPYGGITGSQPIAQKQAIEQKQLQTYGNISNPLNQ